MRVAIGVDGTWLEVSITRLAPQATLADLLLASIGHVIGPEDLLWVDATEHRGGDRLQDIALFEGSLISRHPHPDPVPLKGWTATVIGGPGTGALVPLPQDRALTVGRSPGADVTLATADVSRLHATLEVEGPNLRVRDQGSTNGTYVDGTRVDEQGQLIVDDAVITLGNSAIRVCRDLGEVLAPRPGSLHNVTAGGTVPFNRPPQLGRSTPPDPVRPPTRKVISPPNKFSIVPIVGPLVMAVAMVAIMGNMMYAMIAILSPVLGVGNWFEQKRRRQQEEKAENQRFETALIEFAAQLDAVVAQQRQQLRMEVPDSVALARWSGVPTVRLWHRRDSDPGFLALQAGVADLPWDPPLDRGGVSELDSEVAAVVAATCLGAAPVVVDLTDAGVVGIVGERQVALDVARSLVLQATAHCGPADLTMVLCCDPGRESEWDWASWLPHTRVAGAPLSQRWLSNERSRSEALLRNLRENLAAHSTPTVLLVLDSDVLTEGREAPARLLLGSGREAATTTRLGAPPTRVSGVVLAERKEQLPASCTTVIEIAEDGTGVVSRADDTASISPVILAGCDTAAVRTAARLQARFEDPELVVPGAALPGFVRLPPLLGLEEISAHQIRDMWHADTGISTPVGVGEQGPFSLDLVRDGPHGLVGGTTGSGKSEFLRTLVAGLAARSDPTKLTFVLIDFKGGAAFAACERLPHTIGTISNLDEQLADRAIRALTAELEHRQRAFAAAGEGVSNLNEYLATDPAEPMPRLLLVIDEFAMLARDMPDVLSALVSIGAIGRTLGVHMILATQRPAGVVNDDILANTNLRVALRVQSRDDSANVIDVPDAASIGRSQMGRAFVKLGQNDITPVQTALVTGLVETEDETLVEVEPVGFGVAPPERSRPVHPSGATDLDVLIDAIVAANDAAGFAVPRAVWPEPLAERVELIGFESEPASAEAGLDEPIPSVGAVSDGRVEFAVSDDPDHQRRISAGWDFQRGNLLLIGIPGSGTSTTLSSLALVLAGHFGPDELDILTLDMGAGDLRQLSELPHSIGYAASGSAARETQVRFLKYVRAELDRRKAAPSAGRRLLVLIDGLATLRDEFQDYQGVELLDGLYRAYADGPELGMHFAVTTTRSRAVPSAIDEVTTQKWLFRLADVYDYTAAGLQRTAAPAAVAGRCVLTETKLQTHVATPGVGPSAAVERVVARWQTESLGKGSVVSQLPEQVSASPTLVADVAAEPWQLPIGIRESDHDVAWLELYENEHALIAGPARSGKSTLLLAVRDLLRRGAAEQGIDLQLWAICSKKSPLADAEFDRLVLDEDDVPALVSSARMRSDPLVLLVDDAERFEDGDKSIEDLLAARLPQLHIIAAGRNDELRALYMHWTKTLRKSRCGVLLEPSVDNDGELLGASIPRIPPAALRPGRGYLCMSGAASFLQSFSPAAAAEVDQVS